MIKRCCFHKNSISVPLLHSQVDCLLLSTAIKILLFRSKSDLCRLTSKEIALSFGSRTINYMYANIYWNFNINLRDLNYWCSGAENLHVCIWQKVFKLLFRISQKVWYLCFSTIHDSFSFRQEIICLRQILFRCILRVYCTST